MTVDKNPSSKLLDVHSEKYSSCTIQCGLDNFTIIYCIPLVPVQANNMEKLPKPVQLEFDFLDET